jgi:hypothetical protein
MGLRENTRSSAHENLGLLKLSIIQVCIRYKMGQLTAEQRIFEGLCMANLSYRYELVYIFALNRMVDIRECVDGYIAFTEPTAI